MSSIDGARKRFRYQIQLSPQEWPHDIKVEIFVEGKKAYGLKKIEKMKLLHWTGLILPCDVHEGSRITIQITELRMLRAKLFCQGSYEITNAITDSTIRAESKDLSFSVYVRVLNQSTAEQVYKEALETAQRMERQRGSSGKGGKAGEVLKTLLDFCKKATNLDPTGGATAAFSVCVMAWQQLEEQEKRDETLNAVFGSLVRLKPSIEQIEKVAENDLKETVTDIVNLIEDVSVFVLNSRSSNRFAQVFLNASNVEEAVAQFDGRFRSLKDEFDRRLQVQQYLAMEAERKRAQAERSRARLMELRPVDLASYNPSRRCLAGTRLSIIDTIVSWTRAENGAPSFAWVHGLAGLGKSTIAASVCEIIHEDGALASSFFCRRDTPELRDPRRLLMTVVCGLAQRWEAYGTLVAGVIKNDIELHTKHLLPLYNSLVAVPLANIAQIEKPSKTYTIVVDALDECGDSTTRKELLTCFRNMTQLVPGLKVVLTSRREEDIAAFFQGGSTGWFTELDVLQYDAANDIHHFVRESLSGKSGIDEALVDAISVRANGLFIWAQTACHYVLSGVKRAERLKSLISGDYLRGIDGLYTAILTAEEVLGDDETKRDILDCLGIMIVISMNSPLSLASLAQLVGDDPSQEALQATVSRLGSVLYLDDNLGGAIRFSHPSFVDYITTPSRSGDLCVNIDQQHRVLAAHCLRTMIRDLSFNLCGLQSSAQLNQDIPELEKRVKETIGGHLSYSCIYWATHISMEAVDDLDELLHTFLHGLPLMYWLEALSLLGMVSAAPSNLLKAMKSCTTPQTKEHAMAANDAYRFVLAFYDPISTSAPHLYISALALAPDMSRMAQHTRGSFPNLFNLAEGGHQEWSIYIRSISIASGVESISLSPNGMRIISGSEDGKARIWDAETGEPILASIQDHSKSVRCVAFSPSGLRAISGSEDMTIRIWDTSTGKTLLGPLRGHSDWVRSVAYSPDGRFVASGSDDRMIRIWDANTGEPVGNSLLGHSYSVLSVAFSPDSRRIVSGSGDSNVRLWDVETGEPIFQPLEGHTNWVLSAAFSPDGQAIVSGSYDRTVRVWSCKTGKQVMDPLKGHSDHVMSVGFTPDGLQIVSGSKDGTVRVWNAHSGALVLGPLTGHSGSVNSVVVSADGKRIVSGSSDKTIRIWDNNLASSTKAENLQSQHSSGHSDVVQSVAFSPNGRSIVSGSSDKTVRVWDIETGCMVLGPLKGHSAWVYSVAFSPDGLHMASGSWDNTVRIWDTETGAPALRPLQGHSDYVRIVVFSPSGTLIASGSDDQTVRIWSVSTGNPTITLTGHSDYVRSVAFSPDGGRIVSGSNDGTLRVWDVGTGNTIVGPIRSHSDYVLSVAFSPGGHHVVSGFDDGVIRTWDAQTGEQVLEIPRGHSNWVNCVVFSPDGQCIISCSSDSTIRIWDAKTGDPVLEPLRGHSASVSSVAVSSDGRYIVSGSLDKTIRIWDASPYLTSEPQPVQYLPGTTIQTLHNEDNRLLVGSAQLARHIDSKRPGWVLTTGREPLLWLPPELRAADDSLMCISHTGAHRRAVIDFSRFVYGDDWAKVKARC
ncbi:hypothetical protein RhiLY_12288 [Ceratobasidium sp. AG-Ba]|nr:hypothetical protein RhiLY_12288 [Ceratobasidium sp. AG-Ba]